MIVLPLLYGYFMDDNRKMMFKRKTKVILLPILLLLSTNIQAQNGKPISVDDAVSIGLQNNIGLKTYQLQIEQNRALVPSAFTIGKTGVYYGTDENNIAENEHPLYVVGASQEFNFPTVYAARLNANKIGVSISQAEYNKARFLLVKEINKAYYNILYLLNKQKHYQFISDIYSRSSEMADKQFNAGETTYLEKLNATAKQQQAIIQLEQTISDLNVAYNKLYLLLQTRDSVFVPYRELFPLLLTDTVISNPELQIADQRIKYESSMLNVERNNILPDINFEVFNGTNRFENAKNYWGWQIGVSIPLFFGEQKSKIRARKYGIQMAESMKQAYLLSYSTRQNELRQQLEKYYKNISFYTDSGKKISDEIIRFAEASYNVGEIDFFKYIQNLENATSIKINYLDNLAEYNNIVLELNYLTIE
ncbi:MAG: TolC family protein [Dysgonamonadaceae bacterium]|nr:TolC family protein [Dysgonamonadaceae bacterium]